MTRSEGPHISVQPRRVVVICVMTYGDLILAIPFFRSLKLLHPSAKLSVVTGRRGAAICRLYPWVDEVISLDGLGKRRTFFSTLRKLGSLTRSDLVFALYPFFLAGVIAFFLAGKRRVGFCQAHPPLFVGEQGIT